LRRWIAKTDPDTTHRLLELTRVIAIREQQEYQPSSTELMNTVKKLCSSWGIPVQFHHYYIALAEEFWRLRKKHNVQTVSPDVDSIAVKWLLKGLNETLIYAIGKLYGFEAFEYMSKLKVSTLIEPIAKGTITADGTEQTLLEYTEQASVISGYVDLSEMTLGDTVIIRQYMKTEKDGEYKKYAEETYIGKQDIPLVYITPKVIDVAVKITLQQTAGTFKTFTFSFMRGH